MELLPREVKAVAVIVAEKEDHASGMLARPTSSGAVHAVLNHALHSGFDGATANGEARVAELVVAHVRGMLLEEGRSGAHGIGDGWGGNLLQRRDHLGDLACAQMRELPLQPCLSALWVSLNHLSDVMQAPFGMVPVEDVGCLREVQLGDAANPGGAIIDAGQLLHLVESAPQPLGAY